jgi:hypothetical protein
LKYFFSGNPAAHREETLTELRVPHRLVSYAVKGDVAFILKKQGRDSLGRSTVPRPKLVRRAVNGK